MSTFSVINLGCKVNRVEADGFERALARAGAAESDLRTADLIIVNTCTVTSEAEKKARKAVRHALRENDHAPVVVTGCAAVIAPNIFMDMSERVEVIPKAAVEERAVALAHKAVSDAPQTLDRSASHRTRLGIKVQDGCDNACSYCIVCIARGPSTSVSHQKVIDEAVSLARSGVREIVLSGINIGAYDDDGITLSHLLKELLEATASIVDGPSEDAFQDSPVRFRLSSIEPQSISDELIDLIARSQGRICAHLHIPLQSGSTRVLREMRRQYTAEDFSGLITKMRERVPFMAVTTDVIVGFPGETEEDFEATCEVVEQCVLSGIHVFPYSQREGTDAAARPDQVPASVKAHRARKLRQIARELAQADLARRADAEELFLIQEDGRMMSESYHEFPAMEGAPVGRLVRGRVPGFLIE